MSLVTKETGSDKCSKWVFTFIDIYMYLLFLPFSQTLMWPIIFVQPFVHLE